MNTESEEVTKNTSSESSKDCKKMCDFLDNVDVEGCTWGVWSKGTVVHEKKCNVYKYSKYPGIDIVCSGF